jgi:hypothetical protein
LECAELAPALGRGEALESAGKPDALQTLRDSERREGGFTLPRKLILRINVETKLNCYEDGARDY